jgi:hypothetical protein
MEKEYDFEQAVVKLVGKDQQFVFGAKEPIKVNNDTITRITTWNNKIDAYNGSLKLDEDKLTNDLLSAIFCVVLTIRTKATEELHKTNKELLSLSGYNVKYYSVKGWEKSFASYSLNRLLEVLESYKDTLKRKQQNEENK